MSFYYPALYASEAYFFRFVVRYYKAWFTSAAHGHSQAHDQLKVAGVFTPAAHALAHPSSALARLRRIQSFKLFLHAKVKFDYYISKIEDHIKKESTFYREAISSTDKLAVCLR